MSPWRHLRDVRALLDHSLFEGASWVFLAHALDIQAETTQASMSVIAMGSGSDVLVLCGAAIRSYDNRFDLGLCFVDWARDECAVNRRAVCVECWRMFARMKGLDGFAH